MTDYTKVKTHAPLPWVVIYEDAYVEPDIIAANGETVSDCFMNPANAAFIVKACNHHNELVEALKALLDTNSIEADSKARSLLSKLEAA